MFSDSAHPIWSAHAAWLLSALLLFSSTQGSAQVILTGTVLDADGGMGLSRANIEVENAMIGTITDADGTFRIEVERLPVTLIVSHIGYEKSRVVVSENMALKVRLRVESVAVEDLVVVGSRFVPRTAISSPVPIDNIGAAELAGTGQPSVDKARTYTVPAYNSTQQTISDATAHFDLAAAIYSISRPTPHQWAGLTTALPRPYWARLLKLLRGWGHVAFQPSTR